MTRVSTEQNDCTPNRRLAESNIAVPKFSPIVAPEKSFQTLLFFSKQGSKSHFTNLSATATHDEQAISVIRLIPKKQALSTGSL